MNLRTSANYSGLDDPSKTNKTQKTNLLFKNDAYFKDRNRKEDSRIGFTDQMADANATVLSGQQQDNNTV